MREKQKTVMQPRGKIHIDGVRDDHFVNTDYVLICYESIGNYSWGKKYSGHQSVKTGGKEKDWFTCQLSMGKGGMKYIPYFIFKQKDSILCMHYLYVILNYLVNQISFSPLLLCQDAPAKPGKNAVM